MKLLTDPALYVKLLTDPALYARRALWTTGSNGFNVVLPSMGTARAVNQTNLAAAMWGSPGYVKLLTLGHTNIGTTYLSNVVLRAVQVK